MTAFDAQFNYCASITSSSAVRGGQGYATYPTFGKSGAAIFKPASPLGMLDATGIIGKCTRLQSVTLISANRHV